MPEGIQDLEAAFAAAASEVSEVPLTDADAPEPGVEAEDEGAVAEQAVEETGDQPDVAETTDTDLQSLVDEMVEDVEDNDEDDSEEPSAVTLDTEITVDLGEGPTTVTIRDLVDGGLRQADYTRKTQELAAQRKDNDDAIKFHDAFMEDPIEFTRALAVRAQLLDADTPVRGIEAAKIQTETEIEAEVERRLEERLASDPRARDLEIAAARSAVDAEFNRISEAHGGIEISPELRQQIIDEAARRGTADLELVFEARLARVNQRRGRVNGKKGASTSRPTASPLTSQPGDEPEPIETVEDAFERALAEVG